MRNRSEPLAPPLGHGFIGHIEQPRRVSRELSALTPQDLSTPAIVRRAAATTLRDEPANSNHQEWMDLDAESRREMKDILIAAYAQKLGNARVQLKLIQGIGSPSQAALDRIARLERNLDAVRRLP